MDIDAAIRVLEKENPRLAEVVKARVYARQSDEETARQLGISASTVQRDWVKALSLLRRLLSG